MSHAKFLTRCLQLANYAKGRTSPNPMVGAVIVYNGKIIGEGYHHKAGDPHAEVMAIESVKDPSLLVSSTLYCSLEPCAHYGKTPPCSLLITDKQIPKVVIGCSDTHELVNGQGVKHLQSHGVEVLFSSDPIPFRKLNQVFFCNKERNRPFVTIKWAQSFDGYIDRIRKINENASLISSPLAAIKSHQIRSEVDGILISAKTLNWDRPSLSTRNYNGTNPRPIILVNNTLPDSFALDHLSVPPIFIGNVSELEGDKIICDPYTIEKWLPELLNYGIHHVLVEGGGQVIQSFVDSGLVDQWHRFTSINSINEGVTAPKFDAPLTMNTLGTDRYERG